jgi:hypothetical protein
VPLDRSGQAGFAGRARRANGREDAAAGGMQLLVARSACAERELVYAVTAERSMRVAVHETGDRTQPAAVQLGDVAVERRQVAHPSNRLDRVAAAEDEGVLEHFDLGERTSAQRSVRPRGRRKLREIAEQQARGSRRHASPGTRGIRSPPSSAAASASG